jgi:hypothetical protein
MKIKPISYYLSIPVESELLTEVTSLDYFSRCMLCSVLFTVAALKGSGNFGAVKYHYALIRVKSARVFAQENHWLDILNLACAIGMYTFDVAAFNNKGKNEN